VITQKKAEKGEGISKEMPFFCAFIVLIEGLTGADTWSRILVKWGQVERSGGGEKECS
jgi:hypothetical protein